MTLLMLTEVRLNALNIMSKTGSVFSTDEANTDHIDLQKVLCIIILINPLNEFLKRDFPRVPIINSPEDRDDPKAFYVSEDMFRAYVNAGERLRKLHLMQTKTPATLTMEPGTSDDLEIGAIKYKDGVLHLNAKKRISGIPENVWSYRIGGYQVLDKWFKSHKGENLTIEKYDHICNVVGLLSETIKIQEEMSNLHK